MDHTGIARGMVDGVGEGRRASMYMKAGRHDWILNHIPRESVDKADLDWHITTQRSVHNWTLARPHNHEPEVVDTASCSEARAG
jgi:hypothetical protein